eukprot:261458_1
MAFVVFLFILIKQSISQDIRSKCSIGLEMVDLPPNFVLDPNNNPQGFAFRVPLTKAAQNDGAVCLDGSTPDFYYRPGFGDGKTKFNINIAAGGWCMGLTDPIAPPPSKLDSCYHRRNTTGGSNRFNKPYGRIFGEWHDINATRNPLFYNWNEVNLLYCDGGSFTADNETVYVDKEHDYTLYFRGNRILKGFFDFMWNEFDMKSATDITVGGCSAGGLSLYLHNNWIYETYIAPNPSINFLGIADSGFFMEYEGLGKFVTGMQWLYEMGNVTQDTMDTKCMEYYEGNEWKCMFAQNNVQFMNENIKFLSFQSRFDRWQLQDELMNYTNDTATNEYGLNMTYYYLKNYLGASQNRTAFFDSCMHHCGNWQNIHIDDMMQTQVMVNWFYDNQTNANQLYFQNETYPCDQCCS